MIQQCLYILFLYINTQLAIEVLECGDVCNVKLHVNWNVTPSFGDEIEAIFTNLKRRLNAYTVIEITSPAFSFIQDTTNSTNFSIWNKKYHRYSENTLVSSFVIKREYSSTKEPGFVVQTRFTYATTTGDIRQKVNRKDVVIDRNFNAKTLVYITLYEFESQMTDNLQNRNSIRSIMSQEALYESKQIPTSRYTGYIQETPANPEGTKKFPQSYGGPIRIQFNTDRNDNISSMLLSIPTLKYPVGSIPIEYKDSDGNTYNITSPHYLSFTVPVNTLYRIQNIKEFVDNNNNGYYGSQCTKDDSTCYVDGISCNVMIGDQIIPTFVLLYTLPDGVTIINLTIQQSNWINVGESLHLMCSYQQIGENGSELSRLLEEYGIQETIAYANTKPIKQSSSTVDTYGRKILYSKDENGENGENGDEDTTEEDKNNIQVFKQPHFTISDLKEPNTILVDRMKEIKLYSNTVPILQNHEFNFTLHFTTNIDLISSKHMIVCYLWKPSVGNDYLIEQDKNINLERINKAEKTKCIIYTGTIEKPILIKSKYVPSARQELLQIYLEQDISINNKVWIECKNLLSPKILPKNKTFTIGISQWDILGRQTRIDRVQFSGILQTNKIFIDTVKVIDSNKNSNKVIPYALYGDTNTLLYTIISSDIDIPANSSILIHLPQFWYPHDLYPKTTCIVNLVQKHKSVMKFIPIDGQSLILYDNSNNNNNKIFVGYKINSTFLKKYITKETPLLLQCSNIIPQKPSVYKDFLNISDSPDTTHYLEIKSPNGDTLAFSDPLNIPTALDERRYKDLKDIQRNKKISQKIHIKQWRTLLPFEERSIEYSYQVLFKKNRIQGQSAYIFKQELYCDGVIDVKIYPGNLQETTIAIPNSKSTRNVLDGMYYDNSAEFLRHLYFPSFSHDCEQVVTAVIAPVKNARQNTNKIMQIQHQDDVYQMLSILFSIYVLSYTDAIINDSTDINEKISKLWIKTKKDLNYLENLPLNPTQIREPHIMEWQSDTKGCDNLFRDGSETDIDCGGIDCEPCEQFRYCLKNTDCIDELVCGKASYETYYRVCKEYTEESEEVTDSGIVFTIYSWWFIALLLFLFAVL